MKKIFAAIFILLLTPFLFTVYADGETAQAHNHFACGTADCEENHESVGKVDWQAWDGDTLSLGLVSIIMISYKIPFVNRNWQKSQFFLKADASACNER